MAEVQTAGWRGSRDALRNPSPTLHAAGRLWRFKVDVTLNLLSIFCKFIYLERETEWESTREG